MKVLVIFFFISIIILIDVIIERNNFKIKKYNIINNKIDKNISIAFLSDLHSTSYGKNNKRLIDAVIKLKPDYILICGDMITHKKAKTYYSMKNILLELNTKLFDNDFTPKIYYVFGNHEKKATTYAKNKEIFFKVIDELKDKNISFLFNNSASLTNNITLHGIDINIEYYNHINPKRINNSVLDGINFDEEKYNILLSHHPGVFNLDINKADLTLSGHLHGGMIYIPFIGGIVLTDSKLKRKYAKGIYNSKLNNKKIIIGAGLGDHIKSFRINNTPELVYINLKKDEDK